MSDYIAIGQLSTEQTKQSAWIIVHNSTHAPLKGLDVMSKL